MQKMRFLTIIILLTTFLTTSGQTRSDTTKFKSEIPTWRDGRPDLFFSLAQQKGKQLSLQSLESGFDSLQIRIWYDYSLFTQRDLLIISRTNSSWTAFIYNLTVAWDSFTDTEKIKTKKYKGVIPKNGWDNLINKLIQLKITTLPNMDDIPGLMDGWTDEISYNVEVSTTKMYRFYGYHLPDKFQDKYWQAKNMVDILRLIEKEFGLKCNCE
jgi:hypothetical protein